MKQGTKLSDSAQLT